MTGHVDRHTDLSVGLIREMRAFSEGNPLPTSPNLERGKKYIRDLLDIMRTLMQEDISHLMMCDFKAEKVGNFDAHDTAKRTMHQRQIMIDAIQCKSCALGGPER